MRVFALTGLLLYVSVHTAPSDISNQIRTEGSDALLFCVNDGKVLWSKGVDGGRRDILTAERGEVIIKHNPDPDNRYTVFSDSSLHITDLSLSDSGVYYCNSVPVVSLTVTPSHERTSENKSTQTTPTTTTSTGVTHRDRGASQNITPITSVEEHEGSSDTWTTERTSENKSTQTTPTTTTSTGVTHRDRGASQNITPITSVEEHEGSSDTWTTGSATKESYTTASTLKNTERTSENKSTQTTPTTTTSTGVTHRDRGASQNITPITSVEEHEGSSDTWTTGSSTKQSYTTESTVKNTERTSENKSTQTTPTTTTSTGVTHRDRGASQNITPITSVEEHEGSSDTWTTETTQTTQTGTACVTPDGKTATQSNIPKSTEPVKESSGALVIPVSVLVGVSVAAVIVAVLLRRCFFRKRTAKGRKTDHIYESIEDVTPTAQKNLDEAIYVLAGDTALVNLGNKTQTDASSSSETQSPTNLVESVYSTIQGDEMVLSEISPTDCKTQHT
ncbi:uncharacterized protein LOC108274808 isoform X2 [Ictalurus punctatus]|uniref:Uncharacterized protein LOC108274808 isoform X2 n=1 Tax=Ictalurus punctatus TaxID=7998 RepID=A0A9F7RS98_ICTPU|nr:uncharacterized protein LOC108274808 isoform X2 [Ictalurus punctatus]